MDLYSIIVGMALIIVGFMASSDHYLARIKKVNDEGINKLTGGKKEVSDMMHGLADEAMKKQKFTGSIFIIIGMVILIIGFTR